MTDRSRSIGEVVRFLLVGGSNTVVTGLIFFLLTSVVPTSVAYVISYGVGIVFAGVVIPTVVFGRPASVRLAGRVGAGYFAVLVLGLLMVAVLDPHLGRTAIVLVVLAITVPANFVLTRWLSRAGQGSSRPAT